MYGHMTLLNLCAHIINSDEIIQLIIFQQLLLKGHQCLDFENTLVKTSVFLKSKQVSIDNL